MALTDDSVVASVTVAAARRLAAELRLPSLPLEVEAAFRSGGTREPPRQFADPVALASLVVSVAALAWQVYCDKKKEGGKPTGDTLITIVRVQQWEHSDLTRAEEKIVEVVAAEIIKAADDED
jgi:hypothetical protein